jgi:hypothetical protein
MLPTRYRTECRVCYIEHDPEIHEATLSVRRWFRDQVCMALEKPAKNKVTMDPLPKGSPMVLDLDRTGKPMTPAQIAGGRSRKLFAASEAKCVELRQQGLGLDQIGEALGCSRYTVYKRLKSAGERGITPAIDGEPLCIAK